MKYAIAQTSGKQFLVKPGEWYDIDFIRNGEVGDYIYLNKRTCLLLEKILMPFCNKATVLL